VDGRVRNALLLVQEEGWTPAVEADGSDRPGAWLTELTKLVECRGDGWRKAHPWDLLARQSRLVRGLARAPLPQRRSIQVVDTDGAGLDARANPVNQPQQAAIVT